MRPVKTQTTTRWKSRDEAPESEKAAGGSCRLREAFHKDRSHPLKRESGGGSVPVSITVLRAYQEAIKRR